MTHKFEDLDSEIHHDRMLGPITGLGERTFTLRWLDEHPSRVPGRTMTESEFEQIVTYEEARGTSIRSKIRSALFTAGTIIVQDPKPTNAERLADALRRTNHVHGSDLHDIKGLSEALDKAGVVAGDDA